VQLARTRGKNNEEEANGRNVQEVRQVKENV
jgi:hypothetical protein